MSDIVEVQSQSYIRSLVNSSFEAKLKKSAEEIASDIISSMSVNSVSANRLSLASEVRKRIELALASIDEQYIQKIANEKIEARLNNILGTKK